MTEIEVGGLWDHAASLKLGSNLVHSITQAQARCLQLFAQGLLRRPPARPRRQDLLQSIRRMQVLQIDTINIVARSPYLVLHARLGNYPPAWLMEALERGEIFECWAHEASFAPADDYLLHRRHALEMSRHWSIRRAHRVRAEHATSMDALLRRIADAGEVSSSDFERESGIGGGWWGWKAEKSWLESWFALGELMIRRRVNFQRIYDVRERVIGRVRADWQDEPPLPELVRREFILRTVKALGVTQARWIADYFRMHLRVTDAELAPLLATGELLPIRVEGWDAPAYAHKDHLPAVETATAQGLRANHHCLLSPFDPIVWDRERASAMFDFDYRLECYTPAEKRVHGYFVLPILSRGRLVGRLDAKAHRAEGEFEVRSFSLQPGIRASQHLAHDIGEAIVGSARWHQTPRVDLSACTWKALRDDVNARLSP